MSKPLDGWHHWSDGLYFKRDDMGSVHIRIYGSDDRMGGPDKEFSIPSNEWCSIMAAVSREGENSASYQAALALHTMPDTTPMIEDIPT